MTKRDITLYAHKLPHVQLYSVTDKIKKDAVIKDFKENSALVIKVSRRGRGSGVAHLLYRDQESIVYNAIRFIDGVLVPYYIEHDRMIKGDRKYAKFDRILRGREL